MTTMRALLAISLALALAACANGASQNQAATNASAAPAATASVATPHPVRMPPKGGPLPPEIYLACKVDADCTTRPHCKDTPCRCVEAKCIALREPVDPVIDPPPADR
jgi:hypothetical protein